MTWLWHPTSDVRLDDPPVPVGRTMISMLVRGGVRLEERGDTSGTSMSVLEKYDYQAYQYSDAGAGRLTDDVLEALDRWTNTGARVLVVGSGTGAECFQLVDRGLRPSGIDFSPEMTAIATENARTFPVPVRFTTADVTVHDEPARSIDAVFFTYSVYSFVRTRDARVRTLGRMRAWLRDGGTIWVSATRADDPYRRCLLAIHRVFQGGELGDSHTRWHGKDGAIRRSYVHVFSTGEIVSELREAGLKVAEDLGSLVVATAG